MGTFHCMWSWIAAGLAAWFTLAVLTGLVIGRAAQLRDRFDTAPVADSPRSPVVGHPDTVPARAYARS